MPCSGSRNIVAGNPIGGSRKWLPAFILVWFRFLQPYFPGKNKADPRTCRISGIFGMAGAFPCLAAGDRSWHFWRNGVYHLVLLYGICKKIEWQGCGYYSQSDKNCDSKLLTLVHTESTAVAVLIMENLFNLLDYSSLVSISSPVYCFRFVDAFGLPGCLFEESKRV